MTLHRHKWEYLSKQYTTIETRKSYYGNLYSLGSSSETTIQDATLIKRFCKRCGDIDVKTVPGRLLVKDLQTLGYYDKEK